MIYVILWAVFCVWLAWDNKRRIENNIPVNHWVNGLLHLTACAATWVSTEWNYGVAILWVSRLVFDVSLNLFRGLGVGYVSPSPASLIDRIEKKFILWFVRNFTPKKVVNVTKRVEGVSIGIKVFIFIKVVIFCLL